MKKKWYRSSRDKMIGGVAGGIADYFDIDPTIVRILFVVGLFMGAGFLAYIVLWIVVPEEPVGLDSSQQDKSKSKKSDKNAANGTADQTKAENRKNTSNIFGAILVVLGVLLLIDNFVHFHAFWPLLLILVGIGILLKSKYD